MQDKFEQLNSALRFEAKLHRLGDYFKHPKFDSAPGLGHQMHTKILYDAVKKENTDAEYRILTERIANWRTSRLDESVCVGHVRVIKEVCLVCVP